jgi:outer membrane lipoprotein-sorting protein
MNMWRYVISLVLVALCGPLYALTGEEIIDRVDDDRTFNSMEYEATMTIVLGSQVREKSFYGYAEGEDRAYMEFIAPARDKGTRFLKLEDEMWMFIPAVEKATKIAGHMLRQSYMGSDFSYDDFTENERFGDLYAIELLGTDTVNNESCHVIELVAKVEDVTYYKRKVWITKTDYIPLKSELYAKSGKLMKEFMVLRTEQIGSYNFPVHIKMINKLRKDTYTEMEFHSIVLDVPVGNDIFTKAYLERK